MSSGHLRLLTALAAQRHVSNILMFRSIDVAPRLVPSATTGAILNLQYRFNARMARFVNLFREIPGILTASVAQRTAASAKPAKEMA
jgi:hypothetical protein